MSEILRTHTFILDGDTYEKVYFKDGTHGSNFFSGARASKAPVVVELSEAEKNKMPFMEVTTEMKQIIDSTDSTANKIRFLYKFGMSGKQICEILHCQYPQFHQAIKKK